MFNGGSCAVDIVFFSSSIFFSWEIEGGENRGVRASEMSFVNQILSGRVLHGGLNETRHEIQQDTERGKNNNQGNEI